MKEDLTEVSIVFQKGYIFLSVECFHLGQFKVYILYIPDPHINPSMPKAPFLL